MFFQWLLKNSAFIAALVALFTLLFLINQHKTSIKPEIVINDKKYTMFIENYIPSYNIGFYITDGEIDTTVLMSYKAANKFHIRPTTERNSLNISPRNIGLGVAKKVTYSWAFDKGELLSIFSGIDKVDVYFDTVYMAENKIRFFSYNDSASYSFNDLDKIGKINYILPIAMEKSDDTPIIKLPNSYLELFALYIHFKSHIYFQSQLKYKLGKKFPDLFLNLRYKDISNNNAEETYVIKFFVNESAGGGTKNNTMKFKVSGTLKFMESDN